MPHFSLVSGAHEKLIVTSDGRALAFDLKADPSEASPMSPPPQKLMAALQSWLAGQSSAMDAFFEAHPLDQPGLVDAAQTEQLRELG